MSLTKVLVILTSPTFQLNLALSTLCCHLSRPINCTTPKLHHTCLRLYSSRGPSTHSQMATSLPQSSNQIFHSKSVLPVMSLRVGDRSLANLHPTQKCTVPAMTSSSTSVHLVTDLTSTVTSSTPHDSGLLTSPTSSGKFNAPSYLNCNLSNHSLLLSP